MDNPLMISGNYSGYRVHGSKSKEHAMSLWKHEENPGKIEINREP